MRTHKAYYTVFALKDKTIVAVLQTRKPIPPRGKRRPRIDEEGVHRWYRTSVFHYRDHSEVQSHVKQSTIATCLNLRRVLRERVESRLDQLEKGLVAIQAQLDRMERMLGPSGVP